MKYSDKVWKYFNFTTTGYYVNSTEDSLYCKKTSSSITGKDPTSYFIKLIASGFLIICPCIFSFSHAYSSDNVELHLILAVLTSIIIPIAIVMINTYFHNSQYKELEPQVRNVDIYKRELPSNLRPAHVYMLLYDGRIDDATIATTILDLVDRGYLEIISEKGNVDDFFGNEKMILRKTNKSTKNLFKYENQLIKWFIDIYGDGNEVNNFQIKESLEKCLKVNPTDMFEEFRALVAIAFPIQLFYERLVGFDEEPDFLSSYLIRLLIGGIISFIPIPYVTGIIVGFIAAGMFNQNIHYVLNQNGVDERDSWRDLKKYLKEFTLIKERTTDEISLYNYYLTYSVVLGENYKVLKEINEFFKENLYKAVNANVTSYNGNFSINTDNNVEYKIKNYKLTEEDIKKIEQDIKEELEKYRN